MLIRFINLLISVTAILIGGFLALNYPFDLFLVPVTFCLIASLSFRIPFVMPPIALAILPIIGFAPWTGWITFEELDLLVLATASGAYAKRALSGEPILPQRRSLLLLALAFLFSLSILVSLFRGFSDSGGFVFGWYQGYDGPMNSIRIGKSFLLALLFAPLLGQTKLAHSRALCIGLAIGLGTASLAILWERLAFTGLLNFSSDYRTTALFWEMHVGGAALDGWLLLTTPFAFWSLRNARSNVHIVMALGLALISAYACLTTFSRGVYLALLVSLPFLAWKTQRRPESTEHHQAPHWGFFSWSLAIAVLAVMGGFVFPHAGYRGLLALTGTLAAGAYIPRILRKSGLRQSFLGLTVGLLTGTASAIIANFLPKGPYLLYSGFFAATLTALYWVEKRDSKKARISCLIGFTGLMIGAVNVADHWGGTNALTGMSVALSILLPLLLLGTVSAKPLWPHDKHWQSAFLAIAIAVFGVVAVFSGGKYMEDRFSTSNKDFSGRLSHWSQALGMLQSPWDAAFGKGLGRFPANYFFSIPNAAFPGTYQIKTEDGNSFLTLVGPRHPISFGDMLRISQRLPFDSIGPFEVSFKVRAKSEASIHVEVCEKHLLYAENCAIGHQKVKPTNGEWQPVQLRLKGALLAGEPWYAPRVKMFSIGIGNKSEIAEVDEVFLVSHGAQNLLKNGNFDNGMQHWFFSSDRDHMPWHAKNLLVNITFDQGIAGLLTFLWLTLGALWRLNFGKARYLEVSPYLTASIVGFLVVGLFDSLTDVPRLAFAYYLLNLYALSLGVQPSQTSHNSKCPITKPVVDKSHLHLETTAVDSRTTETPSRL